MAGTPFYTTPFGTSVSFAAADTTTPKVVQAFPALGGRVFSLSFTNSSGVAQTMQVYRRVSAANFLIREVTVGIDAGINGNAVAETFDAARIPALASMPALLDGYPIGASHEIWASAKSTIASGAVVANLVAGQG